MATEVEGEKPPRRRERKAKPAPRGKGADAVRLSVRLAPDCAERLAVHALKARRSQGAIIEDLIRANLRRYVVQDRGGEGAGGPVGAEG